MRTYGKKVFLLLLLVSVLLSGCGLEKQVNPIAKYAPLQSVRTDLKPLEEETLCLQFIREKLMEQGGIYTRYLESGAGGKLAAGHEVLLESEGLLLRYAVQIGDSGLYEEIQQYIAEVLQQENYLSYRADENQKPMQVNASVDDLRIIRALYEGGDWETGRRYAAQLQKNNLKKGLLTDFYTAGDGRTADTMTLCYGDLKAMDYAAKESESWNPIRQKTEEIMLGGYLGDEFPFFQTRYQIKKGKYSSEDISMVESLLTAYHLAEAGKCPQRTLEWLEEKLYGEGIYGKYSIQGEPLETTQSTAIYALCVLIGQQTGNQSITEQAGERMKSFQVLEPNSEIYGAFGTAENLEVYSFDNLMALLALRTLAVEEVENQEQTKNDTALICEAKEQTDLEELLKSCGKPSDFLKKEEVSPELLEPYDYIVTTQEEVLEQIPEGKKVFAVGTGKLPGYSEKIQRQEQAVVSVGFDEFTQEPKLKKEFYYMEPSDTGKVFGTLKLMQEKEVPYSVVWENCGYASWVENRDLSSIALAGAFREFFGTVQENGKFYVMLDEIYPFTDGKRLLKMGADLRENGIPYLLNVMPVYDNLNYPEFGKWTNRLTQLQDSGGTVLLHEPVNSGATDADERELDSKMLFAKRALSYRGVNLYPMENRPLTLDLEFLKKVKGSGRNFGTLPVDTVLVLPVFEREEEWESCLALLKEKWLSVSDYRRNYPELLRQYREKPELSTEEYQYREKEEVSMKGFFDRSNQILLTIVGFAVVLFLILLIASQRIYQNKFRKR